MLSWQNLPLYTKLTYEDELVKEKETNRVSDVKQSINLILNNFPSVELSTYKEKYESVSKKLNINTYWLSYYFTLCMNDLKSKDIKLVQCLVVLFKDLERLDELLFLYKSRRNTLYKSMIDNLISPYIPEMKRVVVLCKEMFKTEGEGELFGELFKEK
tara:strand:+ start:1401 stop:1874 length:474 start_codon:yes stop_codon:yes gene_type:complete